jgi:hypothetical protein
MIREKKFLVSVKSADTAQSVYMIVFAGALSLVLIVAGLLIILFRSQDNSLESLFGVPLVVGGMFGARLTIRLLKMNQIFRCPKCGTPIKISDSIPKLTCPDCHMNFERAIHSILAD